MTFDTINPNYNLPPEDSFTSGELPPKKVVLKPVIKGPTRLFIMGLLFLISAGSVVAINHTNKKDNFTVTAPQIAATPAPDATTGQAEPETGIEDDEVIEGRLNEHEPDKVATLSALIDEATKQMNNHVYGRRNFFLRKANDLVSKSGRNYEFYLLQEMERIKEQLKKELIKNNTESISGVGGEFTATATDSQQVRGLYGDLIAVSLAMQYIYNLPKEAVPDADSLTARVNIGNTLTLLLDYEVNAKRSIQKDIFDAIERANTSATTTKELTKDGKELIKTLEGEVKSNGK